MKIKFKRLRHESGQVLILVLVLLAVGGLILIPLLSYMSSALKAGGVYENNAKDFYAADSGIEDGFWQMDNDHLKAVVPAYDIYGYDALNLHYAYPTPLNVNSQNVNVTVDNVWVVKGAAGTDLTPGGMGLSLADLHSIIEDARLVVAGSATASDTFDIKLSYTNEDTNLTVSQIGIWLPPGFTYTANSCDLWKAENAAYRPSSETVMNWAGGTVVIWKFNTPVQFKNLAEYVNGHWTGSGTTKKDETIKFTAQTAGMTPNGVSWIYTANAVKDLKFAWDADVRVFKIDSRSAGVTTAFPDASGGAEVAAYGIKVEQRSLARTVNGDYVAIGNSLVADANQDGMDDTPITPPPSTVGPSNQYANIPADAEVSAAYLYWSGWFSAEASVVGANVVVHPLDPDTCSNFNNWTYTGTAWSSDGSKFVGHFASGGESAKYITLAAPVNLSSYSGKTVTISWQQWVAGSPDANDRLYLSISNDGGTTWSDGGVGGNGTQALAGNTAVTSQPAQANYSYTIPNGYLNANFKMRLYVQNFSSGARNCYLDNITLQEQTLNDTCDTLANWTNGGDWSTANSGPTPLAFLGHDATNSGSTAAVRYITLASVRNLTAYNNQTVTLTLQQWAVVGSGSFSINDKLYVSFSSNGGSTWSSATGILIAQGTGGTNFGTAASPVTFSYTIPNAYVNTASLEIRFLVQGFQASEAAGRNCYVDNIKIITPAIAPLNPDTCSNLNNWTVTGDWANPGSTAFRGQDLAGTGAFDPTRYLTLTSGMNLSAYTNKIVDVSWQQWATGTLTSSDMLQFQFSGDNGSTWSSLYTAAQNSGQVDASGNGGFPTAQPGSSPNTASNPSGTQGYFSFQIPNQYLTASFKMRFYLPGFGSGKYCYIDNIYVSNIPALYYDPCTFAPPNPLSGWTGDSDWKSYYNNQFIGIHVSGSRYLSMTTGLDLSHVGQAVAVTWNQSYTGTLTSSDALQYQFSGDGGNTWSTLTDALDSTNSPASYTKTIPSQYTTSNFKLRFYLLGFGTGKSCSVDDIEIYSTGLMADTTAILKINGTQVYFDGNGVPQQGAQQLNADRVQVINDVEESNPGSSYSSFKDVTALVRAFTAAGPNGNHPGNGTYSVDGVDSSLNTAQAYRGWSLIIIYTSPATQGHQLYLYDTFLFAGNNRNFANGTLTDVDFDQNNTPGGLISNFLVPDQIPGEIYSAKITCFVCEGDKGLTGDYIALNGTKLWDGITTTDNSVDNPDNVWNSQSLGLTTTGVGVDVDTFNIRWDSNLLRAGDTSAQLDLVTAADNWDLVYIILSFRSQTATGGTITYLIKSY